MRIERVGLGPLNGAVLRTVVERGVDPLAVRNARVVLDPVDGAVIVIVVVEVGPGQVATVFILVVLDPVAAAVRVVVEDGSVNRAVPPLSTRVPFAS